MSAPRILDLYCCAGAAAVGYHRAGFEVVGIDISPQPRYPFEFIQADAVEFLRRNGQWISRGFDAVHASPPCQHYSPLNAYNHRDYPNLIAATRELIPSGMPYVIENVEAAAAELADPVMLCGPMFRLRMYRHRLFETDWPLPAPGHRRHAALCARNGYLPTAERPFMSIHGGKHSRAWQREACDAMDTAWIKTPEGADWERHRLAVREVCEAIPPAYTAYIGGHLLRRLGAGGPARVEELEHAA